eukprot:1487021-Alexandrium_andersonii.AAC.1
MEAYNNWQALTVPSRQGPTPPQRAFCPHGIPHSTGESARAQPPQARKREHSRTHSRTPGKVYPLTR